MALSKKSQQAIEEALSIAPASDQVGLGIDLTEISRVRKVLERTPSFENKCFSESERTYCRSTVDPAKGYAARFAAKEAAVKALGTGFSEGISLTDIEVEHDAKGRPTIVLHGRAAQIATNKGIAEMALSMSHTETDAVACVIALCDKQNSPEQKTDSPIEELARKFKETRTMLDDIG